MSILDLHAGTIEAATPRYIQPPKRAPEPKFSAWSLLSSVPRGVGEAVAQVGASVAEVVAGYGDVMGRIEEGKPLTDRQPDMSSDFGELLRERGREFRPDPNDSHAAEQVLYGFARGASKVVGGSLLAGPIGVVGAGLEESISAADDLARQGVDFQTRVQAGGVQGAGLALAALPLLGKTIPQTVGLYLTGGPGGFVAQQALTREILQAGGFDAVAEQYDPLDPVGLAVSALVPAVFTAAGIRAQRRASAVSREVADAARVALQVEQRRASNQAPDVSRSADMHEAALVKAEDAIARGEPVQVVDALPPRPAFEPLESFLERSRIAAEKLPPDVTGDFISWVRGAGGIALDQKLDITGDANGVRSNPGGIFRAGGQPTDMLAEMAIQRGYLRPGASSGDFVDLVQRHLRGERVLDFDQQMQAGARAEAEQSMAARLQAVEDRLRLLGVDPAPARGNVAALEAYAKQHEPAILAAALDEARAASDWSPEFDALRTRAQQIAADVRDSGRTLEKFEAEIGPLSPVMGRLVDEELKSARTQASANTAPAAPARGDGATPADPAAAAARGAAETPGVAAEQGAASARLDQVRAQFPDLMVRMDDMDAPMRLDDFLAAVKAEADELEADAPLMQVAAECALLNGA